MTNQEKIEGYCNAKADGAEDQEPGYCSLPAGWGTDHNGEGRCKFHGGAGSGAPKGNQNAQTHGIYSQRSNYYNDLSAEEKAWVDSLVQSMLDDAPFTKDNFQKFQMLREIAIDMHKKRHANNYIAEAGIIEENLQRDEDGKPIRDSDGELVTETDENPVNVAYDRLDRTMTRKMKELGILDDPESANAEASASIAEQLAKMREEGE